MHRLTILFVILLWAAAFLVHVDLRWLWLVLAAAGAASGCDCYRYIHET